jgi:hypothetical protein
VEKKGGDEAVELQAGEECSGGLVIEHLGGAACGRHSVRSTQLADYGLGLAHYGLNAQCGAAVHCPRRCVTSHEPRLPSPSAVVILVSQLRSLPASGSHEALCLPVTHFHTRILISGVDAHSCAH